jgi:hypothetical protein
MDNTQIKQLEQELAGARNMARLWKRAAKDYRLAYKEWKWLCHDTKRKWRAALERCSEWNDQWFYTHEFAKLWKRAAKFRRQATLENLKAYNQAIHTQELICARIYERHCSEHHNADFEVCKDAMCAMVRDLGFDTATKEE